MPMVNRQPTKRPRRAAKPPLPASPEAVSAHRATLDSADLPLEQAAALVLGRLQHAMSDLLRAAPQRITSATDVKNAFQVDYRLAWQSYRLTEAPSPLAAGTYVPAKVSLQKLLRAAAHRKVPAGVVARVRTAFEEYERLVEAHAGDRRVMETMIGSFVPEVRADQELASKESAYRAMSHIKGVAVDASFSVDFRHPAPDGRSVVEAGIVGVRGLRRMKPGSPMRMGWGQLKDRVGTVSDLRGRPCDVGTIPFLTQFCTSPLPAFEFSSQSGIIQYHLGEAHVGLQSALDLVMGFRLGGLRRYATPEGQPTTGISEIKDIPSKRSTVDIFIHRDLYPGSTPELAIYDTFPGGPMGSFRDSKREQDRLDMCEAVRPLGWGLASANLPHVPRYMEMLEYLCAEAGWNASEFRGYRMDVQYPVYGAQYMMGFQLPRPPE